MKFKIILFLVTVLIFYIPSKAQGNYQFADDATINSCGNTFLQKISADFKFEFSISVDLIKVPVETKLNIKDYLGDINIMLIKYVDTNKVVAPICNKTNKILANGKIDYSYKFISGKLFISKSPINKEQYTFWFKDLVFKNPKNEILELPKELFNNINVGFKIGQ